MNKKYSIFISKKKLSLACLNFLYDDNIGAIVTFIGVVRKANKKKSVSYIEYSIFDKLMYSLLEAECLNIINTKHTRILIAQRVGKVTVGEINLILGVSAIHRAEAFANTNHLIEFIKNKLPIWKKEFYNDNSHSWLNA